MHPHSPLALALIAGSASLATAQETPLRTMPGMPNAQIQINLSTGERTITPWTERTPRGASAGEPDALWLNNNDDPCATGAIVGVIDDVDTDNDGFGDLYGGACVGGTFPCEGAWFSWWGDLHASDAVVERVVVRYGTAIPDVDLDSDGIGDGVAGFDLYLNFADNDNGFGADLPGASGRSCIIELCLEDLPGQVGNLPPGFLTIYEVVIDLTNQAPSMVFELGDSDGVDDAGTGNSGGALFGNPTFADLDDDGRHDFSWGVRFDQSDVPQSERGPAGIVTAAPKLGNPGDIPHHPADAVGLFDCIDMYSSGPQCKHSLSGSNEYIGFFWFGTGLSCEPGNESPHTSSFIELYGRTANGCANTCSVADYVPPCGVRDFSDVLAFLTFFAQGDPAADLAEPFGEFSFSDVIEFLTAFGNGCP